MADPGVGRLLCVGLRGARAGDAALEADLDACARAGVGAVLLFDRDVPSGGTRNVVDADQLRALIAHVRARLGEHVLVAIDQEGGRVARLSPEHGFEADPSAAAFAALDGQARAEAATRQAERLAALGIDVNFAPCVDLAVAPDGAVIAALDRSYGRRADVVTACAAAVLDAHARAGVAACLKHFPGHGSARGDTHRGAVDVTATWRRDEELAPYRALASRPGVAVMAAHVMHRDLDPDLPASLSPAVIGGLLRGELGFDGVVATDSIDMRAVADRFSPGEAAVAAVSAGADLVIDGFNLERRTEHPAPVMADALRRAVDDGRLDEDRIRQSDSRLDRLRAAIGRP